MSDRFTVIEELAALTAIQDDSTVSRTVLKAEGARCVLFAFDAGQVLTEHTAAMPVLITVLSGALRVIADEQDVVLRPGGVIHMSTRLPHAVEALEPTKMALYMLDPRQQPAK